MTLHDLSQSNVILDATSVINLCACGYLQDICSSIQRRLFVASYVIEKEARYVYGQPARMLEDIPNQLIDWESITRSRLLTVTEATEEELHSWISIVAMGVMEGDAITCAIAHHRHWVVATDSEQAIIWLATNLPEVSVTTTLDLVWEWSTIAKPNTEFLRDTLQRIREAGAYEPYEGHHLHNWWVSLLSSG